MTSGPAQVAATKGTCQGCGFGDPRSSPSCFKAVIPFGSYPQHGTAPAWEQRSQLQALLPRQRDQQDLLGALCSSGSEIFQAHDGQGDRNTKSLWLSSSLSSHGRSLQDIKHGSAEAPEDPALTPEDVGED